MSAVDVVLLLVAGVLAGVAGSVAGLASLVSYPALLAVGLPALTANVTNTVSLVLYTVGASAFSRRELVGQSGRLRRLALVTAVGGAAGAALLLSTPPEVFELLVPVLIGAASGVLLLQPGVTRLTGGVVDERNPLVLVGVFAVGVYGGYFGAAAGVVLLALLTVSVAEPLARLVAARNVALGLANAVAAVGFAVFGPVRWAAAAPLAAGFLLGGGLGPGLVRRLPGDRLRVAIALLGLGLAIKLGIDAAAAG
ncbi:MAG TPA: sulfite exporter TauE/SafE family protein [Actinomycetes bacterium]|nr:sulfite exporter TauE/SafE family protein [Actinomycetes bacterium]